jgi:HSP20 family protein
MNISDLIPDNLKKAVSSDVYNQMKKDISDTFEKLLGKAENKFSGKMNISVEVCDVGDAIQIHAELPGIKEHDIQIHYVEGALSIHAEKKEFLKQEKENYYAMELNFGKFYRSIPLHFYVDRSKIKAELSNGILSIWIPKPSEKEEKFQSIPIETKD